MDAQDFRSLQEAYIGVYDDDIREKLEFESWLNNLLEEGYDLSDYTWDELYENYIQLDEISDRLANAAINARTKRTDRLRNRAGSILPRSDSDQRDISNQVTKSSNKEAKVNTTISARNKRTGSNIEPIFTRRHESYDLYDIILSHLIDEGYADTQEAAERIMVNMSEEWREDIMEKEDSEYEKASDAALDSRYGYGRASGDKRSFGRAANRSSAAAALRALRRGERSGSGTSREAGSNAVHQGWAKTAKTSTDQTPEKKERRAGLANTPYSDLPDDEKEKDRVSFDAVRATYNRNKR